MSPVTQTAQPSALQNPPSATLDSQSAETRILRLPNSARPYADKYFLNTEQILKGEGLNPWVRAQVMIRQGPGTVGGIDEAIAIVGKYSKFFENGGLVYALRDGDSFQKGETLMFFEGPIQDIVALETMYLGVISAETTRLTDGRNEIDLGEVQTRMEKVVTMAGDRPVIYFGARHWRYDEDAAISRACFLAGAKGCSTDAGAETVDKKGVGTMPHVLENIMAWRVGPSRAVIEASLAFARQMPLDTPLTTLIDYNNREIDDALGTARALGARLQGVRVDTCGENIAQGALRSPLVPEADDWRRQGIELPSATHPDARYWYGNGVTITGVYALRRALDAAGRSDVKITLSSGFGDTRKIAAFLAAEKVLGVKLFDSLGVGGVYDSRSAKMDIVRVGTDLSDSLPISKAGRQERPNSRLINRTPKIGNPVC